MTITVTTRKTTGPGSGAGVTILTTSLAAPAAWTRLTAIEPIPSGGCLLRASSDAEQFRISVVPPVSSGDAAAIDNPPDDNGFLVGRFGGSPLAAFDVDVEYGPGTQVWVKQA